MMQQKKVTNSFLEKEEERTTEFEAIHEYMKDTGFSVYSDPKFLYLIGKICVKSKQYSRLALQSFYDYLMILTYYKDQIKETDFLKLRCKTLLYIAKVLLMCGQFE